MEREPDIDALEEAAASPQAPVAAGEVAAIFAGGFLGALIRAGLADALAPAPASWPWPTFAVNLAAALLLGCSVARLGGHPGGARARAFAATGVCGALSTFSTVVAELIRLDERAGLGLACGYGAASLAGGFAAVALGLRLARGGGS